MGQSREDKIHLTYTLIKSNLGKQGITDRLHGRTVLYLAEVFDLSPLVIQRIINDRK
jgi:hypothetical protein